MTANDKDSRNNSLLSYSFSEDDAKRIGSYFKIYTKNNQVLVCLRMNDSVHTIGKILLWFPTRSEVIK